MIRVNEVSKTFGANRILYEATLTLREGEVVGLVGYSGGGKTTLLRIIAGLIEPDSGTVTIDDKAASSPAIQLAPQDRGISMVFQSPGLWPHMTVDENIRFSILDQPKASQDARVDELLSEAGLSGYAGRLPSQLSGGEARRVSILRALAPSRRYLLMDEPLVNLDPELKSEIHGLIEKETNGTGVLYVTHDDRELEGFADRILRLRGGRVEG